MSRILDMMDRHTSGRTGKRHNTTMAIMHRSGKSFKWHRKHLLGLRDLSVEEIEYILDTATGFEQISTRSVKKAPPLRGKVVVNLFFEDSTRTRASFSLAASRLSADVMEFTQKASSVSKGETLLDTARNLEAMGIDIVVIRHSAAGVPMLLSRSIKACVVNAGDGYCEHPTQGLLDLYTIQSELGTIDGLHVAMVGDLKNGRTVHSLARLLRLYDTRLTFVSPEILRLPEAIKQQMIEAGRPVAETSAVEQVIDTVDVLYVTRVQKERFADLREYEAVKDAYEITPDLMARAREHMALMHPLPRVGEIHYDVDDDPRAAYFRQMENGMYVRMALLAAVLGKA